MSSFRNSLGAGQETVRPAQAWEPGHLRLYTDAAGRFGLAQAVRALDEKPDDPEDARRHALDAVQKATAALREHGRCV